MSWLRLHLLAEGVAEENFANDVIKPHLHHFQIETTVQRIASKTVKKGAHKKGGITDYRKVRKHLLYLMREQSGPNCYFTTMFDIYHMPRESPKAFPGYDLALNKLLQQDFTGAINILTEQIKSDIQSHLSQAVYFVPYFQLHEFEALIFANLSCLSEEYELSTEKLRILEQALDDARGNPEHVNHEKGPAERIQEQVNRFNKSIMGPMIVQSIGLPELRAKCANFNAWISQLENLTQN